MDVVTNLMNQVVDAVFAPIATLLFGVAIVVFVWGLIKMIGNSDSSDAVAEGKRTMVWGLVGIFIMLSVLGIKQFVIDSIPGNPNDPTEGIF